LPATGTSLPRAAARARRPVLRELQTGSARTVPVRAVPVVADVPPGVSVAPVVGRELLATNEAGRGGARTLLRRAPRVRRRVSVARQLAQFVDAVAAGAAGCRFRSHGRHLTA